VINSATILLVDDDEAALKMLTFALERDGHHVIQERDGDGAVERLKTDAVDLVVLDIMLPRLDGLEVCKRVRAEPSMVPIIILSGRDEELDKVLGLELGADDYMTKPFSLREFRSRVRALLRRTRAPRHEPEHGEDRVVAVEGLTVDLGRRSVELEGEEVQLTFVEFELLSILMTHPGHVYNRGTLLEQMWGSAEFRDPRTIDVHVLHLREKLERDSRNPEYIQTVRNVGYRFRDL
jgi:DNA-binding response OmpR family regulator